MSLPVVQLRSGREKPLDWRHPWVFSGAVAKAAPGVKEGELVEVVDSKGTVRGKALYGSKTIALKFLTFEEEQIDRAFFERRLKRARNLRETLGLFSLSGTNCFRLFFGENDGVPGLVLDRYDRTAVMQLQQSGLEQFLDEISAAVQAVFGDCIQSLFLKDTESKYCFGEKLPGEILESEIRFLVDWEKGQKTGFFLDQRENRKLLRGFCSQKRVLNCFCYTGGFSLAAALGGATEVVSVDSSGAALEILAQNIERNGVSCKMPIEKADCFDFLEEKGENFDLIVIDPPAFVKHRDAHNKGIRGYRQLNKLAISKVKPGGTVFTFSCSQLVSREQFHELVFEAAIESGRQVSIVGELHQAGCHPISLSFPEGEYLKGLVLQVENYG